MSPNLSVPDRSADDPNHPGFNNQHRALTAGFAQDPDAIRLRDLVAALRRNWRIFALSMLTCFVLGLVYLGLARPVYEARMILAPVAAAPSADMPDLYKSAASSIGLNLGQNSNQDFDQLIALFGTVQLARALEERHDMLKRVFVNEWNPTTGSWERPASGVLGRAKELLRETLLGVPSWTPPSAQRLREALARMATVSEGDDMFREVRVRSPDRELALDVLQALYQEAERLIREERLQTTQTQIRYFREQLETTRMAELRGQLVSMITSRMATIATATPELPFAARQIDPPFVTEGPVSPRLLATLVASLALGLVLGALLAFVREVSRPAG